MRGYVKRYAADPDGNMRNYFNMKHTDYDDGIFFDRILNGTFTNYNEEITSRENEFDIVFGDFSIAFSLNDSIRSLNGLDVKEFFKPSDNTLYKYAISLNLGVKEIGGIMDNEETTVDKSFLSGRWDITLTFFSWEKEFSEFSGTPPHLTGAINIDDYIREKLFFAAGDTSEFGMPRMEYDLNFNWNIKLATPVDPDGFTPVLVWEAYNQMLINGISENGWQLFKELAFGLGFIFKFQTRGLVELDPHFIKVVLWCGWRSDGINHRDIKMIEPHTETNQLNSNTNLMLLFGQDQQSTKRFSGIIKNKEFLYINDGQFEVDDRYRARFFVIDSDDYFEGFSLIKAKSLVRNFALGGVFPLLTITPKAFDNTLLSSCLPIYRIFYYIDRGGQPNNFNNNRYYFVDTFSSDYVQKSTVAFCRLFVKEYTQHVLGGFGGTGYDIEIRDNGWYDQNVDFSMIQRTAGVEYDYLIRGNANIINTDIHFNSNTELNVYDKAEINGKTYWLRRISAINLSMKDGMRATTEWVQLPDEERP